MQNNLAFGMLPVATVESPKQTTALSDRVVCEFLILGAVKLADDAAWEPIVIRRPEMVVRLLKPNSGYTSATVPGLLTSQVLDVRHTIFRFETDVSGGSEPLKATQLFPLLAEMVHLLRVLSCQYWLGLSMANEGSVFQAVQTKISAGTASFEGQGSFTVPFIINPLTRDAWLYLGQRINESVFPSVAESILCDALLEVRRGDLGQSILLLGVACETEIVFLIEQLAKRRSLSHTKLDKMLEGSFRSRFLERTVELGSEDPAKSTVNGSNGWAEAVCGLYRFRSKIAHGSPLTVSENGTIRPFERKDLPVLVFAVGRLLVWTLQQRVRLGIPPFVTSSMLPGGNPLVAITAPQ